MRSKAEILKIATSGGGCAYYDGAVYDGEVGSIEDAMDEYAKEVAIEFKKWKDDKYWSDYFHDDGHTPLDNAPLWSSDSVSPEMLTTEQLFNQFLQEIKQDK